MSNYSYGSDYKYCTTEGKLKIEVSQLARKVSDLEKDIERLREKNKRMGDELVVAGNEIYLSRRQWVRDYEDKHGKGKG